MPVKLEDFGPGLLLDSHICYHCSFCCTWKKALTSPLRVSPSGYLFPQNLRQLPCLFQLSPVLQRTTKSAGAPAYWSYSWQGPHETPSAGNHSHWTPESPSSLSFWMYQILWYNPILKNKSSWPWWTAYKDLTYLAKGTILLHANILVFLDRKREKKKQPRFFMSFKNSFSQLTHWVYIDC